MDKSFVLGIFAVLVLSGCKQHAVAEKTVNLDKADLAETKHVSYDSVKIHDSMAVSPTLTAEYQQTAIVFSGLSKPVLDSLYKGELYRDKTPLTDYSKTSAESAVKNMKDAFFTETKENTKGYMPDFKQIWDRSSDMKVISLDHNFLTVQYSGYGHSGGAHGYSYENYKNVDLASQKIMKVEDIFEISKVNWNEELLKIVGKEMLFEPSKLTYNQNFYFDKNKITFVYNQYEIAPYAAGIIPISIPFSKLSAAIKPEFKKKLGIK